MPIMSVRPPPVKRWIQGRQKHYNQATGDYFLRLRQALDRTFEQKLKNLNSKTIVVKIESGLEKRIIRGLTIDKADLSDAKLNQRLVLIDARSNKQVASGFIAEVSLHEVRIKLNKQLTLDTRDSTEATETSDPSSRAIKFKIKFDYQEIVENRVQVERALRKFRHLSCSLTLHKCLLGNFKDCSNLKYGKARVVPLEGLIQPKGLQVLAVEQAMKKRVSLIEGVAGSGKTIVAANIACSMSRLRRRKILLCSPLQSTVDRLAEIISTTQGVKVVKLTPFVNISQETKHSILEPDFEVIRVELGDGELPATLGDCSLDKLVDEAIYRRGWSRLKKSSPNYGATRKQRAQMHQKSIKMVRNCSRWLRQRLTHKILDSADVVCCTLAQAGSQHLKGLRFNMLIIDDAHVASEIESLIPLMMRGLKQVTLLSDMRQKIRLAKANGHISSISQHKSSVKCKAPVQKYRKKEKIVDVKLDLVQEPGGLFERWLAVGLAPVALKCQHRMHKTLAAFSNHHFYLSRLKTDPSANLKLTSEICRDEKNTDVLCSEERFGWLPNSKCLTAIFNTVNESDSMLDTLRDILDKLVNLENVHESRIGIISNITWYATQNYCGIQIGTTDDFMGQEKDFIILLAAESSTVGSTLKEVESNSECNYLESDRALHVAITRARLGMFILADLTYVAPNIRSHQKTTLNRELSPPINYCKGWVNLVKYYVANELVELVESY